MHNRLSGDEDEDGSSRYLMILLALCLRRSNGRRSFSAARMCSLTTVIAVICRDAYWGARRVGW